VAEDEDLQAGTDVLRECTGGIIVADVAQDSSDPSTNARGIGSPSEHTGIMVGLEHELGAFTDGRTHGCVHMPQVGEHAQNVLPRAGLDPYRVHRIVGLRDGDDVQAPDPHLLPGNEGLGRIPRLEVALGLLKGPFPDVDRDPEVAAHHSRVGDVIPVLVGDEDGIHIACVDPDAGHPRTGLLQGESGVHKDRGAAALDEHGVPAAPAREDAESQAPIPNHAGGCTGHGRTRLSCRPAMNAPKYGRHIRIGRLTVHFSSLHLLFWVMALAFVGEIVLAGGLASGHGLLDLGSPKDPSALWAAGANGARSVFHNLEWWRLLSSIFLHGSVLHLVMNGLALYNLGRLVDQLYGPIRLLLIFVATGLVASLSSVTWTMLKVETFEWQEFTGISLGASGAVCGLLGILLANMRSRGDTVGHYVGRQLLQWSLIMLVFGLVTDGIDNAAHIGGFVTGYLLARVLREGHFDHLRQTPEQRTVATVTLVVALGAVVACGIAGFGAHARYERRADLESLEYQIRGALRKISGGTGPANLRIHVRALKSIHSNDVQVREFRERALDALDKPEREAAPLLLTILLPVQDQLVALTPDYYK